MSVMQCPSCDLRAVAVRCPMLQRLHVGTCHQHACSPPVCVHGQTWPAQRCVLSLAKKRCKHSCGSSGRGRQHMCRVHAATQDAQWGFHQQRFAAQLLSRPEPLIRLELEIRPAETDDELRASAQLRAESFYAYPPERSYAGKLHQLMIADQEFTALKEAQERQQQCFVDTPAPQDYAACQQQERSVCLVALAPAHQVRQLAEPESSSGLDPPQAPVEGPSDLRVVGTLDLFASRALAGQALIGHSRQAAYLANVCVSGAAQRQGVGQALLTFARQEAVAWGARNLYVHSMAVNLAAKAFYESCGFVLEQEESSNQAHYRGHCLDGIEGRGRTVLFRCPLP